MQNALQILEKYWGYSSFRDIQGSIIQSVLEGKDTFGLLPTGGGKSLCYQLPGMLHEGITLVVSPLVALMKDQVAQLQNKGIKAIALTGGIKSEELLQLLDNCQYGNYKFLYLSPERLEQDWVLERIKQLPITLIAIDEAHCVSQWGHDFRPSYLKVKNLKTHFKKIPFLAVTASATPEVQKDIISLLGLENPIFFQKSFYRENLGYHVLKTEDKLYKVQQIFQKNPAPSIIYVRNRKKCQEYAAQLNALGFKATFYHGGLPSKVKETNMKSWMQEENLIMVATSAFGMGIDKSNVKIILHLDLPENLESYYQEAGRAGRNGQKAFAILLSAPSDVLQAENQFLSVLPDVPFLKMVYVKLCNYFQIAYGEGIAQEFVFGLHRFCVQYQLPVVKTFNALQFLDRQSIISWANETSEKVQVQFCIDSREVIRYISMHENEAPILNAILRNYAGIFDAKVNLNVSFLAKNTATSEDTIVHFLHKWKAIDMIDLLATQNESKITFLEVREDERTINRVAKYLEKQNTNKKKQLDSVIAYVTNELECKNRSLLTYFGEQVANDCGICSYCTQKNKKNVSLDAIRNAILETLRLAPKTSRELIELLALEEKDLLLVLQELATEDYITTNKKNQIILLQ